MKSKHFFLLIISYLSFTKIYSQSDSCYSSHPVIRVKGIDLSISAPSSYPKDFEEVSNLVFFTAEHPRFGRELWRTDGTEKGTFMVKDISDGISDPQITMGIEFNGKLYFTASNNGISTSLWESDGTLVGTKIVSNTVSYFTKMYVSNNKLFIFNATNVLVYDGTNPITSVKSINGGNEAISFNNILYFTAEGSGNGELWKSDGTVIGTYRVKDIHPTNYSYPTRFTVFQNKLYFLANDGTRGSSSFNELWVTDGTTLGTAKIDISSSFPNTQFLNILGASNNTIFLAGSTNNYSQVGIWKSNGTAVGTYFVKEIEIDGGSNAVINNILVFGSSHAVNGLRKPRVWKSDGTEQGTFSIADVSIENNIIKTSKDNSELYFINFNYFTTFLGYDLWKTNGTINGTVKIKNVSGNPNSVLQKSAYLNNKVVFSIADSTHGVEPWITDGTPQGTSMIRDCYKVPLIKGISQIVGSSNYLFYITQYQDYDYKTVYEIYRSSGSMDDTLSLKRSKTYDKVPQYPTYWSPNLFGAINDKAIFSMDLPQRGVELWVSDGTIANTNVLTGSNNGLYHTIQPYYKKNNKIFYLTVDYSSNHRFWVTDGTTNGTHLLLSRMGIYIYLGEFIEYQNQIYCLSSSNANYQILRVNETNNSVNTLIQLPTIGNNLKVIENTQQWNDQSLYYYIYRSDSVHVWRYSITQNSFSKVLQLKFPEFGKLTVAGQKLFIAGRYNLVSVDKTFNTITTLKNSYDYLVPFEAIGSNYYFFTANDFNYPVDVKLWKSDGTVLGTTILKIMPFKRLEIEGGFDIYNGKHFFISDRSTLWQTDGTAANTKIINYFDYFLNRGSTLYKDKFYFSNYEQVFGLGWYKGINPNLDQYRSKDIFSGTSITSQNKFFQYSSADYNASKYINLLPGFDVEKGAEFKAQTTGCPNN